MLIRLHEQNPSERDIQKIVAVLKDGGVIIYPTDTVYGIGCDIFNTKAIERVCRIKGIKPEKASLSFVCNDLSHISEYTSPFDNSIFRMLKKALPGAFTFILKANNNVPKMFKNKKKTVGIRVPDNNIARTIVRELGRPILSSSLKLADENDFMEYPTDPVEIHEQYEKLVDLVIDGGFGGLQPSTVVDCTNNELVVLRQGAGDLEAVR